MLQKYDHGLVAPECKCGADETKIVCKEIPRSEPGPKGEAAQIRRSQTPAEFSLVSLLESGPTHALAKFLTVSFLGNRECIKIRHDQGLAVFSIKSDDNDATASADNEEDEIWFHQV